MMEWILLGTLPFVIGAAVMLDRRLEAIQRELAALRAAVNMPREEEPSRPTHLRAAPPDRTLKRFQRSAS